MPLWGVLGGMIAPRRARRGNKKMLAKVINLRKEACRFSSAAVANYISGERPVEEAIELYSTDPLVVSDYINREGVSEGGSFNLDDLDPSDLQDRKLIVAQMDYIANSGKHKTGFRTNPFYHFVLSWREHEQPTRDQVKQAVSCALKALSVEENQAMYAIHRDKEHHHHAHVVVGRVNPKTLTLSGPPQYDFLILDKVCREVEIKQGWGHDRGPHVVIDGEIKRLSKKQRERLGLLDDPAKVVSATAIMEESKTGLPSLARWMKNHVAGDLLSCETWEDIHVVLANRGLRLEKLKSGLQVVALDQDGRETRTKASAIDYRLSLGRLEKRMGAYRDFQPEAQPKPSMTYSGHLENVMRGVEPAAGEIPGRTGEGVAAREQKRKERERLREALHQRYSAQKRIARGLLAQQRKELTIRHRDTMRFMREDLAAIKLSRVPILTAQHGKRLGMALWAAERARAIDQLLRNQQAEKIALRKTMNMTWVAWVEREAANGDAAACSALRGIRYRAKRKAMEKGCGFEGEDLDQLNPMPTAVGGGGQERGGGGVSGKLIAFDLERYEIDQLRQRVIYRDSVGAVALEDLGQRIECRQHLNDEVIRAGLLLAAQKYGGEVFITGDAEFRAKASGIAATVGVRVMNNPSPEQIKQAQQGVEYPAKESTGRDKRGNRAAQEVNRDL